jgi:methyl-galactoside transport system substrate-binding protein
MRFKRILCLALVVALAAVMNGAAFAADDLEVGFIWRAFNDHFQTGFRKIMEEEAEKAGVTMNMQDGEDDASIANNKLSALLSRGYKLIGIVARDRVATRDLMEKCKAENIPVVFVNTEPMPETIADYDKTWYVGARAEQSGVMSAQVLCDYWKADTKKADKNGDGVLQLIIFQGEPGHNDVELRTKAYYETLKANDIKYEVVKIDTARWYPSVAFDLMTTYLTQLGDENIEGVLCNNDGMAMGALGACKQANINTKGSGKFIPICGIDATIDALEALKDGELLGTCLNDRRGQSKVFLNMIKAIGDGKYTMTEEIVDYPGAEVDGKYVWVPYKKVDSSNVLEALADSR